MFSAAAPAATVAMHFGRVAVFGHGGTGAQEESYGEQGSGRAMGKALRILSASTAAISPSLVGDARDGG